MTETLEQKTARLVVEAFGEAPELKSILNLSELVRIAQLEAYREALAICDRWLLKQNNCSYGIRQRMKGLEG